MTYTIFWNNGISELAEGKLLQDALANKGYSESALRKFEFHLAGDRRGEYRWDNKTRNWIKRTVLSISQEVKIDFHPVSSYV